MEIPKKLQRKQHIFRNVIKNQHELINSIKPESKEKKSKIYKKLLQLININIKPNKIEPN